MKFLTLLFLSICFTGRLYSQYTNIEINSPLSTTPEEVTIAINPANPLNLAAGANISYYYYSTDGGYTWTQRNLRSSAYGVWGDPSVVFDANGNLFFGHLSNPPPDSGYWIDRIVVQKSTDGGQTFNDGSAILYNPPRRQQDKEWLAVDMTNSPYRNFLYAAWTQFDQYGSSAPLDSSRILFSRSTDAGATWSPAVRVSDRAGDCLDVDNTVEGAVPAVGPNGEVYTSWAGPLGIMFDKSLDGGLTWGNDVFVTSQPGGWDYSIPGIYRANGLPITVCDVSNSPYRGSIYVQWTDQRNGEDNTDAFIIKSSDGGQTWGNVIRVNDDTTKRQQFFSWMTVDQSSGNVYVCFYDRRNTTDSTTDFYVAMSTDGAQTFTNIKVNNTSFTPRRSVFFGDYTNIAAYNGKVYPIWMKLDSLTLSVWTAIIDANYKVSLSVNNDWNMLSLPLILGDARTSLLFPSAVSSAFGFNGKYVVVDTLSPGVGYWVKFPGIDSVQLIGSRMTSDTITLRPNWNMIGAISDPVAVSSISTIPTGIVSSEYFAYNGTQYIPVGTLFPGSAYWVKSNQTGELILSSGGTQQTKHRQVTKATPEPVFLSALNTLTFEVNENGKVTFNLFEPEGDAKVTLVDEVMNPGTYQVKIDPKEFPDDTYYYWLYIRPTGNNGSKPLLQTGKVRIR